MHSSKVSRVSWGIFNNRVPRRMLGSLRKDKNPSPGVLTRAVSRAAVPFVTGGSSGGVGADDAPG
jgi:hypothetical protein